GYRQMARSIRASVPKIFWLAGHQPRLQSLPLSMSQGIIHQQQVSLEPTIMRCQSMQPAQSRLPMPSHCFSIQTAWAMWESDLPLRQAHSMSREQLPHEAAHLVLTYMLRIVAVSLQVYLPQTVT